MFWGSVALLDEDIVARLRGGDLAGIPTETIDDLEETGFLVDADIDEISDAHVRYLDPATPSRGSPPAPASRPAA